MRLVKVLASKLAEVQCFFKQITFGVNCDALCLLYFFREIILDRKMDFTDIIKFFNEMAESHSANEVLSVARQLTNQLQQTLNDE